MEHIKFVDFCGKYRVPLLQYLCSPKCSDAQSPAYEVSDSDSEDERIRKVLLGYFAVGPNEEFMLSASLMMHLHVIFNAANCAVECLCNENSFNTTGLYNIIKKKYFLHVL